jgi:predicted permease
MNLPPIVPLTLVVLGAFFYNPPAPPSAASTNGNGHTSKSNDNDKPSFFRRKLEAIKHPRASTTHPGENRTVFVAVISRMILVPAILLPGVAFIARYDSFEAAEDPVFVLAAVLIISSVSFRGRSGCSLHPIIDKALTWYSKPRALSQPPALTLAQITQAASGDAFERLISKTITWSYAVLTPPLTLAYVVLGLVFGRL